jgi:diguanylate cyclase (GGDEF)-like protein/PAS domain S-box-containing protein
MNTDRAKAGDPERATYGRDPGADMAGTHDEASAAPDPVEMGFRLLAESLPEIVWITRSDGWNTYFNRQWVDYTGLSLGESHGHGWIKPFHPDDRQNAWDAWQRAVHQEATYSLECRLRRHDGAYRWWLIRALPLRNARGAIDKWFGTCTNIHELKEAGEAVLASRGELEAALANMNEAVLICGAEGRFTHFNDAYAAFHRYAGKEHCARTVDEHARVLELRTLDGQPVPEQDWAAARALRGETAANVELILQRKDSGEAWIGSHSYAPIRNHEGVIVGAVVACRDITEQKRAANVLRESEERYRKVFQTCLDAVSINRVTDGLYIDVNQAFLDISGFERADLVGRTSLELGMWIDPGARAQMIALLQRDKMCRSFEARFRKKAGGYFWGSMSAAVVSLEGTPCLLSITRDITEQRRAEEDRRIAAIAFDTQEGMFVTDARGVIIRTNQAFSVITGYAAAEAIGRRAALLKSGRQDAAFYRQMRRTLRHTGYWQGEMWNRRRNGETYAEWLTLSAVKAADGRNSHYVGAFSEITKHKEAEAEIHRLAHFDPLTNLPNRRLLHDRLNQALAGSARSRRYGAVLFLDLDNFKVLNDTRGHDVGDELLVETAERIRRSVRDDDTVARLGGDEFLVLLENLGTDAQVAAVQAGAVGEKLRMALAAPYAVSGREFHSAASLGVTLFRGHEASVETVLRRADLAMYQAKGAGRNALRFFDPAMQTALDERSALEADLRLAIGRRELALHFQPQIDNDGHIIGAEALLRWFHPQRGVVGPADFIPLAEETGLILPIGQWVMAAAAAQIAAWSAAPATRRLRLAVNVSARQFRQADFVYEVQQILEQAQADPARLEIELTESVVINDIGDTLEKMHALRAMGIGFALDDFGTGSSSLSYLSRLPLDQLKIDRSFVLNLPGDRNDAIIAQTIITMAASLGLDVIAEGVETDAQRAFLEHHGCNSYQGYHFSRPLPLAEFEAFVAARTNVLAGALPATAE